MSKNLNPLFEIQVAKVLKQSGKLIDNPNMLNKLSKANPNNVRTSMANALKQARNSHFGGKFSNPITPGMTRAQAGSAMKSANRFDVNSAIGNMEAKGLL